MYKECSSLKHARDLGGTCSKMAIKGAKNGYVHPMAWIKIRWTHMWSWSVILSYWEALMQMNVLQAQFTYFLLGPLVFLIMLFRFPNHYNITSPASSISPIPLHPRPPPAAPINSRVPGSTSSFFFPLGGQEDKDNKKHFFDISPKSKYEFFSFPLKDRKGFNFKYSQVVRKNNCP